MIESCGILSSMAGGWMDKLRLAAQGPEAAADCLDNALTAAVALRAMTALASRLQTTLAMDHEGQLAAMQKTFPRLAEAVASQPDVPQLAPAVPSPDSRSSCHPHAQEDESTTCAAATTLVSGWAPRDDVLSGGSVGATSSGDGDSSNDDDDGDWDGFHFPSAVPLSALGVVPRRKPAALGAENNASRDLPAPQRHVPALAAAVAARQCKPVVSAQSGSCGKGLTTQQQRPQQQQLMPPLTQQQRSRPLLSPPSAQQRSQAQRPEWQRAKQPRHQAQAAEVPEAVMPTQRRQWSQVPAPSSQAAQAQQAKTTKVQPRSAPARPQQPKAQPKTTQAAATAKAQLAKAPPPATGTHGQARTQRPQRPRQPAPQRPAGASSVEQPNSSSSPSYMRSTAASCAKALDRGVQQPPASAAAVEVKGCKARRVW
ncbi:hypothetical protein PLESTB_000253100 [Pleodorina starrii]|uniref:Uncharacterized protein n=1 Tax=Pleodorina starrii TaxID=330485 RepID=A0A9W6EY21_9CHLO|nr:hypothetical protein PLESTB_000253100 [Pleodorina starrii]GLC76802.1 hypothetical protein PLESTF_001837300 [Pleodorina starrii]